MKKMLMVLLFLVLVIFFVHNIPAHADGQGVLVQQGRGALYGSWAVKTIGSDKVTVTGTITPLPTQTASAETIACNAGTSPCTLGAAATDILSANTSRKSCLIQNNGTVACICKKATAAGSAASTTNYDFVIKAAGVLRDGSGASYSCDGPGAIYDGAINCICNGAELGVSALQ